MREVQLSVVRAAGRGWAITHDAGVLGYSASEQEALRIAKDLVEVQHREQRSAVPQFSRRLALAVA